MKSFLSLVFVSSIVLTSCKKEPEPQVRIAQTNIVPFTEVGKQMRNEALAKSQAQQNLNPVNQNQTLATTAPVAKGMNPAHGQPNHRCDIPVGAPLNSPVAAAATNKPVTPQIAPQQNQAVSASPVTTTPTATAAAATTPTPEGMNPPHGQTNHRCDIAVGAPLPKS